MDVLAYILLVIFLFFPKVGANAVAQFEKLLNEARARVSHSEGDEG